MSEVPVAPEDPRNAFINASVWHGSLDRALAILAAHPEGREASSLFARERVDHQQHSADVRDELRSIATNLGLAATGSSDYHGTRKTDHDLGCNVTEVQVAEALLGENFDGR